MSKVCTSESRCLVCSSANVIAFVEVQQVPVHCNLLWPTREEAIHAPTGDIRLGFCGECGHIYNLAFDSNLLEYTQNYENSLHFSPRFRSYASSLAERLIHRFNLYGKDIVEIGCGKGDFLELLCELGGNRGVGFDPSWAHAQAEPRATGQITFIQDFYSERYANCRADLICCRHVLEHIPDPRRFMQQIHRAVGKRTAAAVFFEVPNVLYTLRDLGIWDIIYEHCSYFSVPSLTRLFCETGFAPREAYTAFGDQFLCLEASLTDSTPVTEADAAPEVSELRALVRGFAAHCHTKVDLWKRNLRRLLADGRRIVIWGAGSKGVTFLNTIESGERIGHVIDINPRKQGMYVAGTGQRIMAPEWLSESHADTVLVMNPIYKDEIQEKIAQLGLRAQIMVV